MTEIISTIIAQGAAQMNIELPPKAGAAFRVYNDFLSERGQVVNLTAISGTEEIARLHFLDSISLLNIIPFKNKKVIDIGSGAGFPGVPLKIAEPSIDLTLLEATGKRVTFLKELSAKLDIASTCINARAEEIAHDITFRENYDIVVSRAVAQLNILCELCLPFAKVGGIFIAMKSVDSNEEINDAQSSITILGAKIKNQVDYKISDTDIVHRALIIEKLSSTPTKYPRRFAKIQNSPL